MARTRKNTAARKQKTVEPSEEHGWRASWISHPRAPIAGLCVVLAVVVLIVFGQTVRNGFLNFDDEPYVSKNPNINRGVTLRGIAWAFTSSHAANWHPVTSISHMLDVQLFVLNAGGHHLTSVLLHAAAAILLFLALREMTGALWPSVFVAAVFAVHPLRAESVAWVAERKDVLSGLFFMLTLLAYAGYVRRPFTLWRYLVVALCFALGLMSKPMLVTLPLVLLLLDYWPLGRFKPGPPAASTVTPSLTRVVLEKIPLLVLSAGAAVATLLVQTGAMIAAEHLPLSLRIGNALISYAAYLKQMVYPAQLAVFYPYYPHEVRLWQVGLAAALLIGVSVGVLVVRRTHPYLPVGWLWYLGMLVPVIGIVQVGGQAYADRYTYLPQIGITIMVAWAAKDLSVAWPFRRQALAAAGLIVVAALMVMGWIQTSYWRSNESLWAHTLQITPGNGVAHNQLGMALEARVRLAEALEHYRTADRILPEYALIKYNLGRALYTQGRFHEAVPYFEKAIQLESNDPMTSALAHYYLGSVHINQGRFPQAIAHLEQALRVRLESEISAMVHNNLGTALFLGGRTAEAVEHLQRAVRFQPGYAEARNNLGIVLAQQGRYAEAIEQYRRAIQSNPGYARAHLSLGKVFLAQGKTDEAIEQFRRAIEIKPDYAEARQRLQLALKEQGKL